jgi:hypothetical protein
MTLADRVKLIDDMVRENRDVTIKDYLELVKDLEAINEQSVVVKLMEPIKLHRSISVRYNSMQGTNAL